jgi:intergrase/recombinase
MITVFGNVLDWRRFQEYVRANYSKSHASAILNYGRRYAYLLSSGDLSPLLTLPGDKRRHIMAALAALCRFVGKHDEWLRLKRQYGLKSEHNVKLAFQIDDSSLKELLEWIAKARSCLGEYASYLDLLLATGVRPSEGILIFNLLLRLNAEGRLETYYRDGWLEHYRFERIFCRRGKNVYVSYAPPELIRAITGVTDKISRMKIRRRLEGHGLDIKLKQIRKLWASYMTRYLTQSEIDLLQGRVGRSIFMRHYFNPSYISDLKARLEKGVKSLFLMIAAKADHVIGVTGEKKDLAAGGEPSR